MDIFISWSGKRAKHMAASLQSWLRLLIQRARPWMSDEDLLAGSRWSREIAIRLNFADFGIICLTPESVDSHWVMFESGAIAKALDSSVLCPYLLDITAKEIPAPLTQFNAVTCDQDGTFRLVKSINRALKKHAIPDKMLEKSFEKWWPDLQAKLDAMPPVPLSPNIRFSSNLGIDAVFVNRSMALDEFGKYLHAELEPPRAAEMSPGDINKERFIKVVGTSIRGFLFAKSAGFDGKNIIQRAVEIDKHGNWKLQIILTDPKYTKERAKQEHKDEDSIMKDIEQYVGELKKSGVKRECVRFFPGPPSVFGIATSSAMLLNPYPLMDESHGSFSLIARQMENEVGVYEQYIKHHFDKAWNYSKKIDDRFWNANSKTT